MESQNTSDERRCAPRHTLDAAYTEVIVHQGTRRKFVPQIGHAYDISATGIRCEFDEPLPEGTPMVLDIRLPGAVTTILAAGEVVWINDEIDDPGPRRTALTFTGFASVQDELRLIGFLDQGMHRAAA